MTRTRELAKEFHVVHTRVTTAISSKHAHFYSRWAGPTYRGYKITYGEMGDPMISDSDAKHFREWFNKFLKNPNG